MSFLKKQTIIFMFLQKRARFRAANPILMLSMSVLKVIKANHRRDFSTLAKLRTDGNMRHAAWEISLA
jgi:hypothetical protein